MTANDKSFVVFNDKKIRRTWHKNEWYFSVIDVVEALTDSSIPKRYWSDLKLKFKEEGFEAYDKIVQLKLKAGDGKSRETDCANTESMFRIIQSIPSPKAEPFKLWLAKVGYERVQEIENPELVQKRMKDLYRQKGYSDQWIDMRLRGIKVRTDLTNEWKNRGVDENIEFSILTNEISKATFGKTIGDYRKHKNLKNESLRDHMSELELIFTILGGASTCEIAKNNDSKGFQGNKNAAVESGAVAGNARKELESKTKKSVVSSENYLDEPERIKRNRISDSLVIGVNLR